MLPAACKIVLPGFALMRRTSMPNAALRRRSRLRELMGFYGFRFRRHAALGPYAYKPYVMCHHIEVLMFHLRPSSTLTDSPKHFSALTGDVYAC